MKVEIINSRRTDIIPRVGQYWKHTDYGTIYLRINDSDGLRCLPGSSTDSDFFSINITDENSWIVKTPISSNNIVILRVKEPLRFEIV